MKTIQTILEENAIGLEAFICAESEYQVLLERNGNDRGTIRARAMAREAAKNTWKAIKATQKADNPKGMPLALVVDLMAYITAHASKTACVRFV